MKVFLEKDEEIKEMEVQVLKRIEIGREKVWFKEKNCQPRMNDAKMAVRPRNKSTRPWKRITECTKTRPRRSR